MASVTYYVVLPFVRDEEGDLVAQEGIELQSAAAAKSKASLLAGSKAGVVAFSRTGDPSQGEFEPAVVIARYGETPDDLE
ncbi:hypothetical protein [Ancylobacter defluvii]|uniref:Uncharacterized protein n=1 Tax=Ancylobacter defluvii TaxID=1282440 RepID=A0A9W6K0L1_9HYPH|nr:hypothetical protein [Ancylobacter defluvii]MBS7588310.1 hypothetical protein [Ancylobacter defluvii]GLK86707.1 hypothetical protein GCM10017653_47770 [Ancylobacter defluvii]